ncbi:MAG: hypothetical protein Q9M26_02200 [Mariprofundales bacterium]|nr:hypothetical protein [Mariprofundales bacterium]
MAKNIAVPPPWAQRFGNIAWRQGVVRCYPPVRASLWVMLVLVAVGGGLNALNHALGVRFWQVQSDNATLQQAISTRLRQMMPLNFLNSRPEVLAHALRHLEPDIAKIEIVRHLPHSLAVHATIRQPFALWTTGDGRLMLVDGQGVSYRSIHRGEHWDLPLLRCVNANIVLKMVALMKQIQKKDPGRLAEVSELIVEDGTVRIDMNKGAQWSFPLNHQMTACVGHILALLGRAPWRHGQWKIDARQQDRWFVRAGNAVREVI